MVRHVILWKMKADLTNEESNRVKSDIKRELEALKGVIPGLLEIFVGTDPLETSNADLFLDSLFEDRDALAVYADHPAHVKIKDDLVVPNVQERMCMDFEIK